MTQVIITENKVCTKCAVSKSVNNFYVDSRRGYLRGKCKDCLKQEDKAYRTSNPEKKAEQAKNWRQANPDKAKDIAHEKRREARSKEFAPLDVEATIPSRAAQAETARQAIRNKYAVMQTQMDAAANVEELKALLPEN